MSGTYRRPRPDPGEARRATAANRRARTTLTQGGPHGGVGRWSDPGHGGQITGRDSQHIRECGHVVDVSAKRLLHIPATVESDQAGPSPTTYSSKAFHGWMLRFSTEATLPSLLFNEYGALKILAL